MNGHDFSESAPESLHCMEVWGGSGSADCHFVRPGLDVWVWSQSQLDEVAGGSDLRLVSSCASGRITRMLLADVCGLDDDRLEVAAQLRDLMKRNVNTISQNRIVRQMHDGLERAAEKGACATTMLGTYFAPTRSLTLCNAGSPLPLMYQASQQRWKILRPSSNTTPGAAALPEERLCCEEYQQLSWRLEVRDIVLMFNNSWTECHDARGRILGMDGLLRFAEQLDPETPAKIAGEFAQRLRRERADNLSLDDATMLTCQATSTSVPWKDNLLAPVRLLGSVGDRTNLGS